jgi:cobalt-zinc-cadmium efflux system outer membrane protein
MRFALAPIGDMSTYLPAIEYMAACAVMLVIPACVTVDARPDFQRAGQLVRQHTAAAEVYDPAAQDLVGERVAALAADGLTTDEAVQISLMNNRGIQAAFQEIGVSRAEVVQSGLMSNPSLGLSLRLPEGGGLANLTIGLAQQVADLWQIPIRERIAETHLEQTVLAVAQQAVNLAADTKVAVYRLLALRRTEEIAKMNLELVERSRDLAQDRFDAGEAGQLDVNLARVNVLDLQLELLRIRRDRRMARAALGRRMGLARSNAPWTLDDELPFPPPPVADETALLLAAMNGRLDARATAARVRAAEEEIKRQCLSVVPNITFGVEVERPERRAAPRRKVLADTARVSVANGGLTAPDIQSRGQRRAERSQIIDSLLGPTLDITLPVWDQNQAQIAKARYAALRLRSEYENLLDSVALDVVQALTAARTASELVALYENEMLPQARANMDAARRAYQAGEQSILALIEAQQALMTQQRESVRAHRDYAMALAELERAVGGPLPSESDDPPAANEVRAQRAEP